jgi:hypothetical protein
MSATAAVIRRLTDHIEGFVQRPHPRFGGQPVCPFARRARATGKVHIAVVPFTTEDDSAVTWALKAFDELDIDVLLVVHPQAEGVSYPELAHLRERFARQLHGRFDVFTGHPRDPFVRAGVQTREEPFPTLHFVRSETLAAAERRLGPRRRALDAGQPGS